MYFKCSTSAVGLLHEYCPKSTFHVVGTELTCNLASFYVGMPKNALGTFQMLLECHTNIWNVVGMKLECSWNTFPLGMQWESFEHEQNIPTAQKNGPE